MKKKKKAKLNFIGFIVVALILAVLSVVKFVIPGSTDEYMGFIRAIDLGIEYKGGTVLTYSVVNNSADAVDIEAGVNAHSLRIKNVLSQNGYETEAYSVAGSNIVVEIYSEFVGNEILDLINTHNEFAMRAKNDVNEQKYLTQDDIKNCYALQNTAYSTSTNSSKYGVYIEFTSEGQEKFKTLTSDVTSAGSSTGTVYFYIGNSIFQQIQISNIYDQNYVYISGGQDMNTLENTEIYAAQINSSKYDFTFNKLDSRTINSEMVLRNKILSASITGLIVLACMIILIVKFKTLGLVNSFGLLLGALVHIMMLQAVPVMKLTSTALVASLITYVLGFIATYFILNKCAKEYAVGKNLHASIKFGYQKSYIVMTEVFVSLLVASIVFYIFGSATVKYFAMGLIIGDVIYGLTSILLNKLFTNLYHNINLSKAKGYGFRREEGVNELEEI